MRTFLRLLNRRDPVMRKLSASTRLRLELLEDRRLLAANVLVNDPAADTTSQNTQSETSLILLGNSVLVAFNDSGSFTTGTHFTGISLSQDNADTFSDKGTMPDSTNGDAGDPSLAVDNVGKKFYLATLSLNASNRIQIFRSVDKFKNPINAMPGFGGSDFLDKSWITVDNASGSGQGNVYVSATNFGFSASIVFTRSTDGGATFGPSGGFTIATGVVQGSWVAVGPDHSVYVFWLDQNAGAQIKMRKSTDKGVTFAPAVTVATLNTTGVNGDLGLTDSSTGLGFRTNAFPQAVVNPVNGNIYVTVTDNPAGSDKADVYFTQSSDGGSSWSSPTRLNADATSTDQWFPALAVTPDGSRVGVFWYDRRLDAGNNNLIDRFGVTGAVSGSTVTFGANFRVTDQSSLPIFGHDPVVNSTYMGDYDQAVADNSFFYTAWGDGRLGNPDVRLAKIGVSTGLAAGPHMVRSASGKRLSASLQTDSVDFSFLDSMNGSGAAAAAVGAGIQLFQTVETSKSLTGSILMNVMPVLSSITEAGQTLFIPTDVGQGESLAGDTDSAVVAVDGSLTPDQPDGTLRYLLLDAGFALTPWEAI